jgi:transposase-like protein
MTERAMKKSRFREAQIVRILQEAVNGQRTQVQVCRDHGISQNTFYVWKRKYAGMETDWTAPFFFLITGVFGFLKASEMQAYSHR